METNNAGVLLDLTPDIGTIIVSFAVCYNDFLLSKDTSKTFLVPKLNQS